LLLGLGLGLVVLGYYGTRGYGVRDHDSGSITAPGWESVREVAGHAVLQEYLPFIVLLFSLYVISGGLQLRGDLVALPRTNTAILFLGAVLASVIGTTGASMLLIRPLLQSNRERKFVVHTVVFFIFLVSNVGGSLLPIGDPPLFLGYLRGVPFLWTLSLWPPWLALVSALLAIYFCWDYLAYKREPIGTLRREIREYSPIRLRGSVNLLWLCGVVLSVAWIVPGRALPGTNVIVPDFVREGAMLCLAGLSLATTPRGLRSEVEFNYGAILEVAALFLGIFVTMQVPIEILEARGAAIGLVTPAHYFWATGGLSSFLDNAPTYVVFFETARAMPVSEGSEMVSLLSGRDIQSDLLRAVSLGAVFMGANTYIGNGPNFMVKSIAESRGIKMPSFFGYMGYSVVILLPLFAGVTWLFLR
jgi:Na+/H+ antiporter NhaD/arsenite permease-like protein